MLSLTFGLVYSDSVRATVRDGLDGAASLAAALLAPCALPAAEAAIPPTQPRRQALLFPLPAGARLTSPGVIDAIPSPPWQGWHGGVDLAARPAPP